MNFKAVFSVLLASALTTASIIPPLNSRSDTCESCLRPDTVIISTFQLGKYSYTISRLDTYKNLTGLWLAMCAVAVESDPGFVMIERRMDTIQRHCGNIPGVPFGFVNETSANKLLFEVDYLWCWKFQLEVDWADRFDAGQKCIKQWFASHANVSEHEGSERLTVRALEDGASIVHGRALVVSLACLAVAMVGVFVV